MVAMTARKALVSMPEISRRCRDGRSSRASGSHAAAAAVCGQWAQALQAQLLHGSHLLQPNRQSKPASPKPLQHALALLHDPWTSMQYGPPALLVSAIASNVSARNEKGTGLPASHVASLLRV